MRDDPRFRSGIAFGIALGIALVTLWWGTPYGALAQNYGSSGTGTSALSINPQSLTVRQGKSATAKVTVKLASGKTWGTDLQATALPAGVTVAFDPTTGEPDFASTMTVKAAATATPGAYTIKVQATGDDPSPVVQYKVTVQQSSYGY